MVLLCRLRSLMPLTGISSLSSLSGLLGFRGRFEPFLRRQLVYFGCVFVIFFSYSSTGMAATASYTGTLPTDNTVQFFTFSLAAPQTVTLRTHSYAGGVNVAGNVIPRGGFDPILAVFNGVSGTLLGVNDDGGLNVPADINGFRYDTFLQITLPAGSYKVAIMQYDNFPIGPNLTNGFQGSFAVAFDGRTSAWAFDLLNVDAPAIVPLAAAQPEAIPTLSEVALMGLICSIVVVTLRRQRRI